MRTPWLAFAIVPLLLGADAHPGRPPRAETRRFHLKLQAPRQGGIYFSAWADDKDVVADKDASDHQTVTYHRNYIWLDGCVWEATETLTPVDATHYQYQYREAPQSCPDGATAAIGATTPRDGTVTVHPASDDRPTTALTAWGPGGDRSRR
jgi:hypothetical protein